MAVGKGNMTGNLINLIAANIKDGITIAGVLGTAPIKYKATGNIPDLGAGTIVNLSFSPTTVVAYSVGSGLSAGSSDAGVPAVYDITLGVNKFTINNGADTNWVAYR